MRDIFGIFRNKKKGFEEKLNEMYQEIANKINEMIPTESVSYTHLTLPTICSV